ncbi:hypothetical protein PR048_021626 [Dryococelus australis]|uniref:Secreted protein n=1 Tax=Dryococelus australis TaxID=614101 RepID=A0ABQ9GYR3_9NEOP|nr:hypothetical protein PR048_021626 [Dryococelus australis]
MLGAHLLVKLLESVMTTISGRITAWGDSTVVLTWIRTPPHCLKTLVAKRVSRRLWIQGTSAIRIALSSPVLDRPFMVEA